ncbi:MAG TPA: hypothetical protein VGQ93_09675 [Lysobacter sp.]|jgi:hypothetical protein|nr:hypothetical protein [Lysobacter sp.]
MTAANDHRQAKLDADERDLAARLARIGPLDGPSPSLDAKILAAAHAAAATHKPRRHRHWLSWVGVPPALVTGVGVAAAAVLALGLVWQLRPQVGVLPAQDEAASAGDEVFVIAEPAATARAPVSNPPPFPAESSRPMQSAPTATTAGESQKAVAAPAEEKSSAVSASAEVAAADTAAEAAPVATQPSQIAEREAVVAAAAVDAAAKEEAGFVAAPPPPAAAPVSKQNHATYTTAARATAERRERAPVAPAPAPLAATNEEDGTTLDRIEVTGSRVKRNDAVASYEPLSKVPVNDDIRLVADEWLERIRARRDEGDLEGARASLRLFRRDHPRVRIPDDLRALLTPDTKR